MTRTSPLIIVVVVVLALLGTASQLVFATTTVNNLNLTPEEAVDFGIQATFELLDKETNLYKMRVKKPNYFDDFGYIGTTGTIYKKKKVIARIEPEETACCLYFYFNPKVVTRIEMELGYAHDFLHQIKTYTVSYDSKGI